MLKNGGAIYMIQGGTQFPDNQAFDHHQHFQEFPEHIWYLFLCWHFWWSKFWQEEISIHSLQWKVFCEQRMNHNI